MNRRVSGDLDAAFSLLPVGEAREAKERVLEARARGSGLAIDLKWTDHRVDGTFLRGGVTDMVSRVTRLAAHSQDDPDLQALARLAREESPLEGALVALPQGDRFAWFVPFTPTRADEQVARNVRGLMVTESIFSEMLDLLQPGRNFTAAERRVMFQVTSGVSLRAASERDGVSFETKRAHMKTAISKMQCDGQKELVRTVIGQLVHLLSVSEGEAVHAGPAEAFVARYLSDDVQLMVRRLANGRILRILSCGPERGRPLVMIHGMMFPISLVGSGRHLEAANIRLLIPVRSGFLEQRSPADLLRNDSLIDESFADLALWLEEQGAGPTPLLGQSLGGVLAIRFANRHPHLVSRLVLQSINLTRGRAREGHAGAFYGGLKRLSEEPDIFHRVNWQYYKYYANRETGRTILSRLFDDMPVDMAVLDGETTGVEAYRLFADFYASSVFGMSGDFDFVMNSWQREARQLAKPITFVHGSHDPLTSPAEFAPFTAKGLFRQHIIPDGGHFVAASHAAQVWKIIAEELGQAEGSGPDPYSP